LILFPGFLPDQINR